MDIRVVEKINCLPTKAKDWGIFIDLISSKEMLCSFTT